MRTAVYDFKGNKENWVKSACKDFIDSFFYFYMKTYMLHYLYTTQVVQEMSRKYLIFKLHIF